MNIHQITREELSKKDEERNIIFLDIHGTLIPEDEGNDCDKNYDPESIKNLNKLCKKRNAKIVITSTCRNKEPLHQIKDSLYDAGLKCPIISKTPNIDKDQRGDEINLWLKKHRVDNFVILDDKARDIDNIFPDNFVELDAEEVFSKKKKYKKANKILK